MGILTESVNAYRWHTAMRNEDHDTLKSIVESDRRRFERDQRVFAAMSKIFKAIFN